MSVWRHAEARRVCIRHFVETLGSIFEITSEGPGFPHGAMEKSLIEKCEDCATRSAVVITLADN